MYRIIGTDQKEYGPVSRETILQWISEGRATVQSWVRAEGTSGWRRLGSLPEFVAAFSGNQPALTDRPPVAACRVSTDNSHSDDRSIEQKRTPGNSGLIISL